MIKFLGTLFVSWSLDFLHILQKVSLDGSRLGDVHHFEKNSFGAANGILKRPKVSISWNPIRDIKGGRYDKFWMYH